MRKPLIAIVGRPNVGKSTLANRCLGARRAIVDSKAGVTRDRLYFDVEWLGYNFTMIDTGGIIPGEQDEIANSIMDQVTIAAKQADVILFMVDGKEGPTPVDEDIANILRKIDKPVLLVVNKIDTPAKQLLVNDFYSLGFSDLYPISAAQGDCGVGDLLDKVIELIPKIEEEDVEKIPRLAIVGRPNVGKSSIVNFLLGEKRVIVSDKPGTTRDTIDTLVKYEGKEYLLTDTAGIRKRSRVEKGIEYYSVKRALNAIKDSDVTVLISDATEGITDQDKKIIEFSNEAGKALIIVINKWDLIPEKESNTINMFIKDIKRELPHAEFAEIVFTNAIKGQRLIKIFDLAQKACDNTGRKISTSSLNQVIMEAISINPPSFVNNKTPKIYYSTQVNVNPPTFMLFVNKEKLFATNYKRYIENQIRQAFDFTGTPIKLVFSEKTERSVQKLKKKGN
jgi:GTP-binding protein